MKNNIIRMVKPFYIDVLVMGSGYIEICFNEPKEFYDHEIFDIEKVYKSLKKVVSKYEEVNISDIYDTNYELIPFEDHRSARAFRLSTKEEFATHLEKLVTEYCITENSDYPLECEYKQYVYNEIIEDIHNFVDTKYHKIKIPQF